MTEGTTSIVRQRVLVYGLTGLVVITCMLGMYAGNSLTNPIFRNIVETLSPFLALMIGAMSLARHYAKRHDIFLVLGVGFLGVAALDAFHLFAEETLLLPGVGSAVHAYDQIAGKGMTVVEWSWIASQLFLSLILVTSWGVWMCQKMTGSKCVTNEYAIYGVATAVVGLFVWMLSSSGLPAAPNFGLGLESPEELVLAALFLVALTGYLYKGLWREDLFEHWLVITLVVSVSGQIMLIFQPVSAAGHVVDPANLIKEVTYICLLAGLTANMHVTLRSADETNLRLNAFIDNTVDGIITISSGGLIESVNPAVQNIFGYDGEELIGQNVSVLLPEHERDDHQRYLVNSDLHAARVIDQSRDINGRRKDGSNFPIELTVSRMEYNGRTLFAGIVRDIAARQRSEQRLAAFVNNTVDGIITINTRGIIETVNPAVQDIFKYRADELLGQNVAILLPADERADHQRYLDNTDLHAARVIDQSRDLEGRRKDGSTFPIELTVSRMEYDGETMFAGIVRDITERKKSERLKNEFVSTVSHELRTPLTSIKGSLGLIEAGAVGELPPELKTMVDIAFKNSERLVRLINDILDIEKIEAGKMEFRMEVHNLSALISSAIDTNAAFADQYGVTLELSEVVPQDRIFGDTDRLQQVFANLLSNAVKFSPKGGNVEIAVSRVNTGFRIAVHDDGPGIPDEYREQIFEKFSQVDSSDSRKKGGTGLGLNIARTIVETHKGKLYFESNPGKGTVFFVDLPEWRSDAAGTDFPERKAKGPKILVCEDEPDIAALLSFILRTGGYQPMVAHTAADAKHLLTEHRFRAMTLDIDLPDQDGISLFRELRGKPESRDLPIIVISAMPDEGVNRLNGDAIGLIDWLVKPIDQNKLALSLDKAMNFVEGMPSILHVEDDPDVRQVVSSVLDGMANVTPVSGVMDAAAALKKDHFDLVILDLGLPDGAGEDLLPLLRRKDQTSIPVVVFSVDEISSVMAKRVSASLVKSRATNETLLKTIRSTIDGYSPRRISEEILP